MALLQRLFHSNAIDVFDYRASIWWKYLDEDSILPPPYTILYFLHRLAKFLNPGFKECQKNLTEDTPQGRRNKHDLEELIELDKREFEKRYKTLMLMLISPQHTNKVS